MPFAFDFWRFLVQIAHLVCYCSFPLKKHKSSFCCWNAALQDRRLQKLFKTKYCQKSNKSTACQILLRESWQVLRSDILLTRPGLLHQRWCHVRWRWLFTLHQKKRTWSHILSLLSCLSKRPLNRDLQWLRTPRSGDGKRNRQNKLGFPEVFTHSFTYGLTLQ